MSEIYEYCRIQDDHKINEFDSLEQKCTEMAKQGWRVVAISDGNTFRYASLERKVQVVITKTNGKEQHVEPVSTRTTKTR